jgi:hypothetical protein
MKPLSRLESLIAEIVERPAWALSSRRINPLELTAALTRGMEARAVRLVDRVLAPDDYELKLNPADLAAFEETKRLLEEELAAFLGRVLSERDLSCNRPLSVKLVASEQVRAGKVQVVARFTPPDQAHQPLPRTDRPTSIALEELEMPPQPAAVTAPPVEPSGSPRLNARTARLDLLAPDGAVLRSFPIERLPSTIGRRSSTEVTLFDTRVSREHARLDRAGGGYTVTDLSSLNGTFVNGQPVNGSRRLRDGDIIEIGRHQLRFSSATR